MRFSGCSLLLVLAATSLFAQVQGGEQLTHTGVRGKQISNGIELLKRAEAEAAVLQGRMCAWVLWQIGIAYQAKDRAKSLELFEAALASARLIHEDSSATDSASKAASWLNARPILPPGIQLQADIARSIVLLEPGRTDEIIEQIDPAARSSVLIALLAQQQKDKQFDRAMQTLNRLAAQDEMPYEYAVRLMETLKPEQSAELIGLFLAALRSYHDHAPHSQFRDEFAVMLSRCWKRLPHETVRQAIDEILQQASQADEKGNYSVGSSKGSASFGSLYEYRLSQVLPVLRELDPSAAQRYLEKYPALTASQIANDAPASVASTGPKFHPSAGYGSVMLSMTEMSSAQKLAAEAEKGHADEALAEAGGIADVNLRAQVYEYIARLSAQKQERVAAEALEDMLEAAGKLEPRETLRYYTSAADIYLQMHDMDAAKKTIETGLGLAGKLYAVDSDDDDPNTALKAFWPSTNAYCVLLREAARISPPWAISLLPDIKDPEIRVAAETALAGGWLDAPIGPNTIMTTKKNSNSISFRGRE
jgi:hypothetical protein